MQVLSTFNRSGVLRLVSVFPTSGELQEACLMGLVCLDFSPDTPAGCAAKNPLLSNAF